LPFENAGRHIAAVSRPAQTALPAGSPRRNRQQARIGNKKAPDDAGALMD
jgi:hypothetical protein